MLVAKLMQGLLGDEFLLMNLLISLRFSLLTHEYLILLTFSQSRI